VQVDECLAYFRLAVSDPLSVPPWSEWWAENHGLVERVFPLMDYVRLKHRRLLGARQILDKRGEHPVPYSPENLLLLKSCPNCGERTKRVGHYIECPICGVVVMFNFGPAEVPDESPNT
jgi:hypothetical protein